MADSRWQIANGAISHQPSAIGCRGGDMASKASLSKNSLKEVITSRYFWIVAVMLAASTFLHYFTPQVRLPPLVSFPLTRHTIERIIFLLPIAGASFAFGQTGGLVTLALTVLILLPRVFLSSPYPADAFLETVAVAMVGYLMIWMIETQERERRLRQKAIEELETLNAIATTVSQSLDLDEILNRALGKVLEVTRLEAKGGIFLLNAGEQKLHLEVHHGLSPEFVRREAKIAVGECLCGLVAESGEVLLTDESCEDAQHTRCRELGPHSHIVVPLKSRDKVLGVMFLYLRGMYQPGAADKWLFASIGNQIGVAIENARLHQDVARQLRIQQRLNEVAERITSELELDRILPKVLQIAEELIDADAGVIALLDRERGLIRYPYIHNLPQELAAVTVLKEEGLAGEVLTTGHSVVIEDYKIYPGAIPAFVEAGATSVVAVPIVSGSQLFGMLAVGSLNEVKGFSERDAAILAGVGRQTGIAIENARLYENMRFYARQITRAQEDERKRIARELHDETAQALIDLSRRFDNLATQHAERSEFAAEQLEEFQELIDDILQGVRRFSRDLRPSVLDDLGLLPALEGLMADVKEDDGIETELRVCGDRRRLPPEAELVLFRIVQEALSNVKRHSQASQVVTTVEFDGGRARITVDDDGQGFEVPDRAGDLVSTGKLGLIGMRERAQLLGGTLTVRSELGKGTTVVVDVPA
jgi:signal transduction histidine kinase